MIFIDGVWKITFNKLTSTPLNNTFDILSHALSNSIHLFESIPEALFTKALIYIKLEDPLFFRPKVFLSLGHNEGSPL